MKEKAFTLIEVMVVMAIISILAGMLTPIIGRLWESEEIATTRERMKELKMAMIGDRNLIQNGVRTHYGFVGDFGELPFVNNSSCALNFLDNSTGMTPPRYDITNWSGRYLSSTDPSNYAVDAWGTPIKCIIDPGKSFKDGRLVAVTLRSVAPSGEIIEEYIVANDVIPTNRVTGNVFASYSALIINITPEKAGAFTDITNMCKTITPFSSYTTLLPYNLPIGKINVTLKLSKHSDCSSVIAANSFYYMVQDNIRLIKIPDLNIP